jgi:hypothetical protein
MRQGLKPLADERFESMKQPYFIQGGVQGGNFILRKNQFLSLVPPLARGVRGVVQDLSLPLSHLKGVR